MNPPGRRPRPAGASARPGPATPAPAAFTRRRCHALGAAFLIIGLAPGLGACAAGNGGVRTQLLTQQRLNELLAGQFPYTRSLGGLAELSLRSPRLGLLPASNRLTTACDLVLSENIARTRYSGGMDLDYGLRFDAQAGAIRMADVRVNQLRIDQVPRAQQQLISQYAPRIAEQLLADLVIYRFPPEQLELARNLGLAVGALQVTREGLSIEMLPQGLR